MPILPLDKFILQYKILVPKLILSLNHHLKLLLNLDFCDNNLLFNSLPKNFNSITNKEDISNFFYSVIKKRDKVGFYILDFCCRMPIKMIDFLISVRNKFKHKVNINVRKTSDRSMKYNKLQEII